MLSWFTTHADEIDDPLYPFHPQINVPITSSNLPIVLIDLDERMADKEEKRRVSANMRIIWNKDGSRNYTEETTEYDYDGKIGIRYRGNSSSGYPKKPFSIRTEKENGKKKKVSILGIGEDNDWALLASYADKTLIKNTLIFSLMDGTFEYTPSARYCEVIINGVYQGVYILASRVRQGKHRVNIDKPSSDEGDGLTGGYLLEIDRPDTDGFLGKQSCKDLWEQDNNLYNYFQLNYPDLEDLSPTQWDYIKNEVWEMETAIGGDNFKDIDNGFRAYIDTTSLKNLYITQEFTKNVDGYRLSTPLYKHIDSIDKRFKFSIWDFDFAFGLAEYGSGWGTDGWVWNSNQHDNTTVPWMFKHILQDEKFYTDLKNQWKEYRNNRLSDENIASSIDSLTNLLQEAQERNASAWDTWDIHCWPRYHMTIDSWEESITHLKTWINSRTTWIDSQWSDSSYINYVANSNFDSTFPRKKDDIDSAHLPDWQTSDENTSYLSHEEAFDGTYALSMYPGLTVYQTLTEIPSAKYTFRFRAKTKDGAKSHAYIKYHNSDNEIIETTLEIKDNEEYAIYEITDVDISGGILDIGFKMDEDSNDDAKTYIDKVEFADERYISSSINENQQRPWNVIINRQSISLNIDTDMNKELAIEIYDTSGKIVYKDNLQGSTTISDIFRPANLYILRINGASEKILF